MENWKNIGGYEGIYEVSSIGRIARIVKSGGHLNNRRILKNKIKGNGYHFVCLSINNTFKYKHVHRLVAEAFMPNPENKPQVNHLDCNKSNNCVQNLEWVTHIENCIHARENIVFNTDMHKRGISHHKARPVSQYLNGEIVMVWETLTKAAKYYDVSSAAIGKGIKRNNIAVGFYWQRISVQTYNDLYDPSITPPKMGDSIHNRDNIESLESRRRRLKEMTNERIIEHGVECFRQNKALTRSIWDGYARENKTFGYCTVHKKFNGFLNFKKDVVNRIMK